MNTFRVDDAQQERANRLYWNSTDTVEGIAEQLGVSRRSLYNVVQPEPTGVECPDCTLELVFPNRTSRTAGRAVCLECDRTLALEDLPEPGARNGRGERGPSLYEGRAGGHAAGNGREVRLGGLRDGLAAVEPRRAAMIGGAAVLGAVAGVASASLLRRLY
jgi:hypothetical protein